MAFQVATGISTPTVILAFNVNNDFRTRRNGLLVVVIHVGNYNVRALRADAATLGRRFHKLMKVVVFAEPNMIIPFP